MTQICIFEDGGYHKLAPLSHTRPVYALRLGIGDLKSKFITRIPGKNNFVLHCRPSIAPVLAERTILPINQLAAEDTIFINGRIVADLNFLDNFRILAKQKDLLIVQDGELLLAAVSKSKLNQVKLKGIIGKKSFPVLKTGSPKGKIKLINYFWDLVNLNGQEIAADYAVNKLAGQKFSDATPAALINPDKIYLGQKVVLKPGVVLDATGGPIVIDDAAEIFPNAVIIGPAYIGKKTSIKAGAKIYQNCSFGPRCKIGGELEGTIVQGYSNKQHEGFLGHSYLGEWVNLGAGTENSDLKNNYKPVEVPINGKLTESNSLFVGCCIGDHTKTGIKTMINTGSVFGIFNNIFGAGYQPKYLPDFTWQELGQKSKKHQLKKALATARLVMERRGKQLTKPLEKIYSLYYN